MAEAGPAAGGRWPAAARLVVVADAGAAGEARARDAVAAALAALPRGAAVIVDRDGPSARPVTPDRARLARLRGLRAATEAHGAWLVVTARADLAAACGADGVQLPERGLDVAAIRRAFPGLAVGRSCHDRAGLLAAAAAGADWATLSPVRAPISKAAAGPPLGVAGFAAAAAGVGLPVVALGGVAADLAPALREAGAAALAGVGAVVLADRPGEAASALLAAWEAAARHGAS